MTDEEAGEVEGMTETETGAVAITVDGETTEIGIGTVDITETILDLVVAAVVPSPRRMDTTMPMMMKKRRKASKYREITKLLPRCLF